MPNETSIEDYIAGFPKDIAERLRQVRASVVAEVSLSALHQRSGFVTASQQ